MNAFYSLSQLSSFIYPSNISDSQQTKLLSDMEKVGEDYINIYKFDEHESNGEFINELSVLLHI